MQKIDTQLLQALQKEAGVSQRKRQICNFHTEPSDPLQRMVNCLNPGSYVPPHKHEQPRKREAFIALTGRLLLIEFDEQGEILEEALLDPASETKGAEITPGRYHTLIALEENTCVYEVKDGPYDSQTDKQTAPWAPAEDDPDAAAYLRQLLHRSTLV